MRQGIILLMFLVVVSCTTKVQNPILKPEIVSKKEWGGNPPTEKIETHVIEKITIHHSGVVMPKDKDPIQAMRGLQSFSVKEKSWIDIPYHFSIDLDGRIYEARPLKYPGDTNTEYNPSGHALINVMGNYEEQKVSEAQLQSLAQLCAYLSITYNVKVKDIATHKDYSKKTVCPGKDLYRYFESGEIHKRIKKLIKK